MSGDKLFPCHNAFHIGAYQAAINAGADLNDLSESEATERDALCYRAYIALGSHQARAARQRGVPCWGVPCCRSERGPQRRG